MVSTAATSSSVPVPLKRSTGGVVLVLVDPVLEPDGAEVEPDGAEVEPDGAEVELDGTGT
jgi:hypothetical protein